MSKVKTRPNTARDVSFTPMDGAVMRRTNRNQVIRIVIATLGTRIDVVHIHKRSVPAAREHAATVVPPQHRPAHCGRNVLTCSGRRGGVETHVGLTKVLRVTHGHRHDLRANVDELAAPVLFTRLASFTHGQRNLIAGTRIVFGAAQHGARHQQHRRVVIERLCRVTADLCHRLAKGSERFARELEAQHMAHGLRVASVSRSITGAVPRNQLFYFADGSAPRSIQPVSFGLGRRDTGQLAQRGPAVFAGAERVRHGRKGLERFGDTQLVLDQTRAVPEQPFDVLGKGAMTQAQMHPTTQRLDEPPAFIEVETSACKREARELLMGVLPIRYVLSHIGQIMKGIRIPILRCIGHAPTLPYGMS
jgi:hypothetical protein